MKVGFIGLGIMGKPMALNLIKGGHSLSVYARRAESMQSLSQAGAATCASPQAVAENCDVTFVMVSDTPDVEQVALGANGLIHGARKGSVVVDMSTISPVATRTIAAQLAANGVEMLDAPVSGGEVGAINGTLSIMVGGKPEVFDRVKPLFECMGKNIVHIGDNGAGQVAKACNQIVAAVTIEAVAEALTLARKLEVDPARVREALMGGFAASKVLEFHGKRMLDDDFKPGFKVKLFQKDMRIILDTAHQLGLALPASALVAQHFNALMGSQQGELDSSVLVKVIERMSKAPGSSKFRIPGSEPELGTQDSAPKTEKFKVGFIGLGAMGGAMARNLMKGGHSLSLFARRPEAMHPLVQEGARPCASPREVAQESDVVFTMVTATADVKEVISGQSGIIHGARRGSVMVVCSTISPQATRDIAKELASRGIEMLDAPVSGGPTGAAEGSLSIMIGGKPQVFARLNPLLQCLGKNIVYIGGAGAGQVAKAANQLAIVVMLQGIAEALFFARATGVDAGRVRDALMGGFAASRMLDLMGKRMVDGNFEAGVEARLHHKDVHIVLNMAQEAGLSLPGAALAAQYFNALIGSGGGKMDSSMLIEVVERMRE